MAACPSRGCHGLHDPIANGNDSTYYWAMATRCSVCQRNGYVCSEGCVIFKAFDSRMHLAKHNHRKHLVQESLTVYPDCDWSPMCQVIVANDGPVPIPLIRLHSVALQSFISETITDGMTAAICHLVCSACFGTSTLPIDVMQSVPLHDTYIVLLTARLVFRIGSVHQLLLSSLLSVMVQARPQQGPSTLPVTTAQMRRVITNLSTRTALASAMPTPRPTELGTRHAYLYLEDAMAHALSATNP